ncbi:MAG: thioredoxin [Nanoarchaeota archaeon]
MSENIIELGGKNFDRQTKKGKWVVDFWASWCGPCKIMSPQFDAAAKELKGRVNFGKVNVDDNSEIANKFEIMSIPTTLFIQDGEVVHASVGAMNKSQILENIENSFR